MNWNDLNWDIFNEEDLKIINYICETLKLDLFNIVIVIIDDNNDYFFEKSSMGIIKSIPCDFLKETEIKNGLYEYCNNDTISSMNDFVECVYEKIKEERKNSGEYNYRKYYEKIKEKTKNGNIFVYKVLKEDGNFKVKVYNEQKWEEENDFHVDKAVFEIFNKISKESRISVVFKVDEIKIEDRNFEFFVFSDVFNNDDTNIENDILPKVKFLGKVLFLSKIADVIPKIVENFTRIRNRYISSVSILIRNFAHNIGSHVINSYVNFLKKNKIFEIYEPEFMKTLNISLSEETVFKLYASFFLDNFDILVDYLKTYVKGENIKFFNYVRERASLWALVSGNAGEKANFSAKDSIKELIRRFNDLLILKRTINEAEGMKGFEIIIEDDGKNNDYIAIFPYGVPGYHALFSIFENIIRNVKHWKSKDKIEIRIKIEEKDKKYILKIHDKGLTEKLEEGNGEQLKKIKDEIKYYSDIYNYNTKTVVFSGLSEMRVASSILLNYKLNEIYRLTLKETFEFIEELIDGSNKKEIEEKLDKIFPLKIIHEDNKVYYQIELWKYEESKLIDDNFIENYKKGDEEISRFGRIGIEKEVFEKLNIENFSKYSDLPLRTFVIDDKGTTNGKFCEITKDEFNKNDNTFYKKWVLWYLNKNEIKNLKIGFKRGDKNNKIYSMDKPSGEKVDDLIQRIESDRDIKYILTHDKIEFKENDKFLVKKGGNYNVEEKEGKTYIGFTSTESWVQEKDSGDFFYKMIEVLESKILFIEERIYKAVYDERDDASKSEEKISLYNNLNMHFIKMKNKNTFKKDKENVEVNGNVKINDIVNKLIDSDDEFYYQFIIIHTSHLESIVEKIINDEETKEELCKDFIKELENKTKFIIFTSGKEEPRWVKDLKMETELRIKFVDYSTLSSWFLSSNYTLDSKWRLVRGLLNL